MTEWPRSAKESKKQNKKYYFTGLPCKNGHIQNRYASSGDCVNCAIHKAQKRYNKKGSEIKANLREQYLLNPKKYCEKSRQYRLKYPERKKTARKADYQKNRERYIKEANEWAKNNPDKVREYHKKWAKNNPDKAYQIVVLRRMRIKKRTPAWLTADDHKAMKVFYKEARLLTIKTGIQHNVDHIIPLNGKNVSGLHVPDNLQILTAFENRSKSNKYQEV